MADSPDVCAVLGLLIDTAGVGPLRKDGTPIFDSRFPRWYMGAPYPTTINGSDIDPPPGYVLFGLEIEDEQGLYNEEAGQNYFGRVHLWALTYGDARRFYRWYKQLVHGVTLTVAGYQPFALSLSKSGPTQDDDGNAWQIEVTQRAEPIEQAA